MTVTEAIEKLTPRTKPMQKEALECLRENWQEAEPRLLAALDQIIENPMTDTPALFEYALFLCAEMRSEAVFERYIEMCRWPTLIINFHLDDVITESMDALLANTCNGRFNLLQAVIENESLNEFTRSTAFDALLYVTMDGVFSKDEFKKYCVELLNFRLEPFPSFMWDYVISTASELGLSDAIPAIESAYNIGLADPCDQLIEDVLATLNLNSEKEGFGKLKRKELRTTEEELHYIKYWPAREISDEEWREKRVEELVIDMQAVDLIKEARVSKGPGRNDPCPCGSGKKYKKCCLSNPGEASTWEPPEPLNHPDLLIDCGYFNYERQKHVSTILSWHAAWREILSAGIIPAQVIDPCDSACELFECCTSFYAWLNSFIGVFYELKLGTIDALKIGLEFIPELLTRFPAMPRELRSFAELTMSELLLKIGRHTEADEHFKRSLSASDNVTTLYLTEGERVGIDANQYCRKHNWELALEYVAKAREHATAEELNSLPLQRIEERIKRFKKLFEERRKAGLHRPL